MEKIKKNQRQGNSTSSQYKILPILTEVRHFQSKKQTINKIDYYWFKNLRNNKILMKRFQRTELLAVANNFIE